MNCKLPNIEITGLQLSDLFFNYEHSNWDEFHQKLAGRGNGITPQQKEEYSVNAHQALLHDAKEFAGIIDFANEGKDRLAALLVDDFLARL